MNKQMQAQQIRQVFAEHLRITTTTTEEAMKATAYICNVPLAVVQDAIMKGKERKKGVRK